MIKCRSFGDFCLWALMMISSGLVWLSIPVIIIAMIGWACIWLTDYPVSKVGVTWMTGGGVAMLVGGYIGVISLAYYFANRLWTDDEDL